MQILFYIHASIAVLIMAMAMVIRNTIHALLLVVFSLLNLAVALYALSAPLAAALEVIVYAGAIMVLFVFAIMLLQTPNMAEPKFAKNKIRLTLAFFTFFIFWAELYFVLDVSFNAGIFYSTSLKEIALSLFGSYALLLEIVSFVLLAGLACAIFVGRRYLSQAYKAEVKT